MKPLDDTADRLIGQPVRHCQVSVSLPPPMSRVFSVAAGLAQWTPEEEAWLAANPRWSEYELRMRAALEEARTGPSRDAIDVLEPVIAGVVHFMI